MSPHEFGQSTLQVPGLFIVAGILRSSDGSPELL
jgi:hypothetical protein